MTQRHLRAVKSGAVPDDDVSLPPGTTVGEVPLGASRRTPSRPTRLVMAARVLLLLGTAAAAAFVIAPRLLRDDLPSGTAVVGTRARAFVRADRDYAVVDAATTASIKADAGTRSLPVFDHDGAMAERVRQTVQKGLMRVLMSLEPLRSNPVDRRALLAAAEPARAQFAGELNLLGLDALRDDAWRGLVTALWHEPSRGDALLALLHDVNVRPLAADADSLDRAKAIGLVVRELPTTLATEQPRHVEDIELLSNARANVQRAVVTMLTNKASDTKQLLVPREADALALAWSTLVLPDLTYNAAETDLRSRRESELVPPVVIRARRGEVVLRPGETITDRHTLLLKAMATQQADDTRRRAALGSASFVALLCLVVYSFGARRVFRRSLSTRDLVFLSAALLAVLFSIAAADAAVAWLPLDIPPSVAFFAVPVAAAAMLVRLTLTPDVALLFTLVAALLGGVVVEPGMTWAVVAVVSSLTGAAGVSRAQRRRSILLSGVVAGAIGALLALTLELFRGALSGDALLALLASTCGGGVLSGLLVVMLTPLVERLFGYVTEHRLYRLADLNHPLLKDLVLRAPGTWHHSVRTASLAEAGALAIGASPLLARTMALYHDIGKTTSPHLFAENRKADDRTSAAAVERMTPDELATAMRAHVTEGLRLAHAAQVPRPVLDAIVEHHADGPIVAAVKRANELRLDGARAGVPEGAPGARAFRYYGRAPQTRESALLLLADQIENRTRVLVGATPAALTQVVDGVVQAALADGVLDECDLSLRDVNRVRAAFMRVLLRDAHAMFEDTTDEAQMGGRD